MRIATVGTGSIVATMIENMRRTAFLSPEAVYSRKLETAQAFAEPFGISKLYTDFDKMCQDPDIDCIYIASPNSLHYSQTKKALLYGKHVICEKPFTPTLAEAAELVLLAKEKHLLLLEAITPIYHPNFQRIRELLPSLGTLRLASATFCQYSRKYDAFASGALPNVFNPAFAGGSLMDINLYNLYFMTALFGTPDVLQYFAGKHENGIDTHGILFLQYQNMLCQCTASKDSDASNGIQLIGDKGYMHITPSASFCQSLHVVYHDKTELTFTEPECAWYYETQALSDIVGTLDYDTCYRQLDQTLTVVSLLEKARKSAGLPF